MSISGQPKQSYVFQRSTPRATTNSVEVRWTKKHLRITLLDVQGAATSSIIRVSDSPTFQRYAYIFFPIEGKEYEGFSSIYHGLEIIRWLYFQFGTGASVHVSEVAWEEWD